MTYLEIRSISASSDERRLRQLSLEKGLALLVFLIVALVASHFQAGITLYEGKSWDGVFYYDVADQIAYIDLPHADGPFVYRLGTPFLASLFSDILDGFKAVNLAAAGISIALLTYWLHLWLKHPWLRLGFVVLFAAHWLGPVRWTMFEPIWVDPWLFVFLFTGLIAILKLPDEPSPFAVLPLAILTFVGVFFREFVLILAVSAVFKTNPLSTRRLTPSLLIPLALGAVALVLTHLLVTQTNNYSFFRTVGHWVLHKDPIEYTLGSFFAFGVLLIVPLIDWRGSLKFLLDNQYLLAFGLGIALVAYVGGSDTGRLALWSSPLIFILAGRVIESQRVQTLQVALIALSMVFTLRLAWTTPDFPTDDGDGLPFLTVIGSHVYYYDLFSLYEPWPLKLLFLLQYLALSALVLVAPRLRLLRRKAKA
jgi:hypothetical protein